VKGVVVNGRASLRWRGGTGAGRPLTWVLAIVTSVEWGLASALLVMGHLAWMAGDWADIQRQWQQDWLSGPAPWLTLLFLPTSWAFHELGRWLMWLRWRGRSARWRLSWTGGLPVACLDPAEVVALRSRAQRASVHLWGLVHAGLLMSLAWALSRLLTDPVTQLLARAWLYAASITLVFVDLNPLWRGAVLQLLQEWWRQPDLVGRSTAWWRGQCLRLAGRLAGMDRGDLHDAVPWVHLPGWAIWHAPLAWCVNWLAAAWLAQALSQRHPHLALLVLASATLALLVQPLWRGLQAILAWPALVAHRSRLLWALVVPAAVLAVLLLACPWPQQLVVPGVVWLPERSRLVAPVDGVIAAMQVQDGQPVYEGQALWSLAPLHLRAVDLDADQMVDAAGDWGQVPLHSPDAGTLMVSLAGELDGRVVRRGQVLGQVLPQGAATVRWVVPASRAQDLLGVRRLSVRLLEQPELVIPAVLTPQGAMPVTQLPSMSLSARAGGPVAVLQSDPQGLMPAEPMVWMEARLDRAWPRSGGLAWVKLEMAARPLGWQWCSRVRQLWRAGF
jgi:hypothetical protein